MPDTSHHYLCPRSTVVEQWQSDSAWIEVVDFDGVIHTYQLRARGDRLELSHSTEPVDAVVLALTDCGRAKRLEPSTHRELR